MKPSEQKMSFYARFSSYQRGNARRSKDTWPNCVLLSVLYVTAVRYVCVDHVCVLGCGLTGPCTRTRYGDKT